MSARVEPTVSTRPVFAEAITTPWGRARLGRDGDDVVLRCELTKHADPCALAALAIGAPDALRIAVRDRVAVAEARCRGAEATRLLEWLDKPRRSPPPPVIDVAIGRLAIGIPPLAERTFLRVTPSGDTRDVRAQAQATYLLVANRQVGAGLRCGWHDGPGIAVDPSTADARVVASTVRELADGIRALDDPLIAECFLSSCGIGRGSGSGTGRQPPKGERP